MATETLPFDIFIRRYGDDSPLCTVTLGISHSRERESDLQSDRHSDSGDSRGSDDHNDEHGEDLDEQDRNRVYDQKMETEWTVIDLKQAIHERGYFQSNAKQID